MPADLDINQTTPPAPIRRTPLPRGLIRRATAPRARGPAARYTIAIALAAGATILTLLLEPFLGRTLFLIFWPAVFASAWFGGRAPGLLTSFVAVVVVGVFVIPPSGELKVDSADLVGLVSFLVVAGLSSWAFGRARDMRMDAVHAAQENAGLAARLDDQGVELAQQLEEAQSMQEELEASTEELAERTLEAETAERFTRGILDSISDPFVVYDSDWRFRYINQAARSLFEDALRSGEDLIGRKVWDVWPELDGTKIQNEMKRASESQTPVSFEAFDASTGSWADTFCYPLPDGGLGVQWKDVTARMRAEEATHYLARASEVLASSIDYEKTLADVAALVVPDFADWCAVSILDDSGEPRQLAVAHVDPKKVKWARELNRQYPPDHSAKTGVGEVIRTGKPELYSDIPDELLVAGAKDEEHLRIIRELGLKSAMVVPLSTHDRTLGAMTIVSAESARRYTGQDLDFAMELARRAAFAVDNAIHHKAELEARQVAEGANAAKTQFLAVMSHELRTPLNAIGGYAELLLMGLRGPLTPDQRGDLERIQRSQRNLLSLINDILNYAKLDAGRVEFSMAAVPMHPLLLELEPLITPQLRARKLTYEYAGCDPSLSVWADPEKVRQVLLNLLSNAIKFTEAEGNITIECSGEGATARVVVRDTGLGIPEDKLLTIFEPFVQLERKLTSTHEGTGLGLAISRDLARGMGGELTVESRIGDGSVFRLTLPREKVPERDAQRT